MTCLITNRNQAKARACELCEGLVTAGKPVSYSQVLELVSDELGYRDGNMASARLPVEPEVAMQVGDQVAGRYLKQQFTGHVPGCAKLLKARLSR